MLIDSNLNITFFEGRYYPKAVPFEIPLERGFMIDTEAEFNMAKLMFKK